MDKEIITFGIHKGESRFTTSYNLNNSIDKFFHYIQEVSKHSFNIEYDGVIKTYSPPKKIKISDKLFRCYNCLDYNCSRCCTKTRFWNIFTKSQYSEIKNKKFSQEMILHINNKPFTFYVENHEKGFCPHLDKEKNLCGIHAVNPIHCALPLLKFKRVKDILYITREMYGRNWNMNCPVTFKLMDDAGYDATIYVLNRVKKACDELNIDNYMNDILKEISYKYNIIKNQKKLGDY